MRKLRYSLTNKGCILIFCMILLAINLYGFNKRYIPWFTDEIGYWASAALIRGYNWKEVMSTGGYYGFGYGLILSLIIGISDMRLKFYCAQFINIIFVLTIYILIVSTLKRFLKDSNGIEIAGICFSCMCYPYFQVYTRFSMSEIVLTCIYIFSVYALLRFYESRKLGWGIMIVICTFFMFSIHLRSLVVVISLLITLIYMLVNEVEKVSRRKIIFCILGCVAMLFVVWNIKNYVVHNLYTLPQHGNYDIGGLNKGNNNFSSYFWILSNLFKKDILKSVVISFEGKVFYILAGSFTLLFLSSRWVLRRIFSKGTSQNPILVYILLGFWGEVALTIISMSGVARFDNLLYGRYYEAFMLPLLCIGVYVLYNGLYKPIFCIANIAFMLILSVDLYHYIRDKDFNESIDMQISAVPGWNIACFAENRELYTVSIALVATCVIILLLILIKKNRKKILPFLTILWILLGQICLKNNAYNGYWTADKLQETAIAIHDMDEKIFYLLPDELKDSKGASWRDMLYLQYMLVDKKLYVINEQGIQDVNKDEVIVIEKNIPNYENYVIKDKIIEENELMLLMTG